MMYLQIFGTVLLLSGYSCIHGYYWREYLGTIPSDALVAGKNKEGNNVYIAQAYIKDCGLVVVHLESGDKEVSACIGGIKKTDKYIKVLCGNPHNFEWMKANGTTLHLDLAGKNPVIGGQEDSYGYMSIGRIYYGGETRIGKVNSFWTESSGFYFEYNNEEKLLLTYEILLYKEDDINIKINELFKQS